jgi:hypothetical protein
VFSGGVQDAFCTELTESKTKLSHVTHHVTNGSVSAEASGTPFALS